MAPTRHRRWYPLHLPPKGTTEVFRCPQCLVSRDHTGGGDIPRFGVLAGRDDSVGTAVNDCIVALAYITGSVFRYTADLFIPRDLAEQMQ